MKLFGFIFFSIGLLFAILGFGWAYTMVKGQADLPEEWVGPGVFTFIGLLFTGIGGGVLYFIAKQKAKRELLLRTGKKLRAVISDVYFNTSISMNNRHPLIVECAAEVSGQKKIFKSHNLWSQKQFTPGQEITVYLDTRDSSNFWVEVGD